MLGMVGLGLLGTAIAHRLLRAGFEVVGYDLSADCREALAKVGGRAAHDALEVARQCDTLVLSLPDSVVVSAVIDQIGPQWRGGMLVIDTTTGDPQSAESAGRQLAARSVQYLDATIAGSSAQVYEGRAIVMAGGDPGAYASAADAFAAFAEKSFHVGAWGSGSQMKLVVNLVLGLNRAVLAEGLTLAEALGLAPSRALEILRASPAYSSVMDIKGPKMLARDFAPQARLSQHLKDVRLMLEAAQRTGTKLPLSLLHRELLERAQSAGFGALDNSAIIEAFRGEDRAS
jgi:3-hydroxyisobutyrate dehydrogenase-like beta-hydroxyacid dehydrogenase